MSTRKKNFALPAEDIKPLIDHNGGCIATDCITVDGRPVGYMYREPSDFDGDMGWRFFAGDESDEYMDNADNHGVYAVNTIANYDNEIIPFIDAPYGSAFARNPETGEFEAVESPVDPDECLHPDFPVVSGEYQLTESWTIQLPHKFNRRLEDDSLILWRLGVTLYFTTWNNDLEESIETRGALLKKDLSPDAFDLREQRTGSVHQMSYRLIEDGVQALNGFVIADDGHLLVAIYFDDEDDVRLANELFDSIAEA